MNWDAIGAVSEGLGSLGVIMTLGYLAVQIGHARREMRRTITQGRLEVARELFLARAHSPEICDLHVRAAERLNSPTYHMLTTMMDAFGFTQVQALRLNADLFADWTYRQQTIAYADELPPAERATFDKSITGMFRPGSVQRFWYDHARDGLSPDAVRYVDALLAPGSARGDAPR